MGSLQTKPPRNSLNNLFFLLVFYLQYRYHISPLKNTSEAHKTSLREHGPARHLQRSPLLAVQVFDTSNRSLGDMRGYQYDGKSLLIWFIFFLVERFIDAFGCYHKPLSFPNVYTASNKVSQATFLRKDDPKLTALLQQAELLTSLSKKVNAENNNQSPDEAWKVLNSAVKYCYL